MRLRAARFPTGACHRLQGESGLTSPRRRRSLVGSGDGRTRPLELLWGKTGGVAHAEGGETMRSADGRNTNKSSNQYLIHCLFRGHYNIMNRLLCKKKINNDNYAR